MSDDILREEINQAKTLRHFKVFCERLNDDPNYTYKLFNIIEKSTDKYKTIRLIFKNRFDIELAEDCEDYLLELINAFFKKKSQREPIPIEVKRQLLANQNNRCAYCGCEVNEHDPVDHIIPFKYVGDELEDNYQILCSKCNTNKNDDIDYHIRQILTSI